MNEQLSLSGFEAPPAATDRLFFAIYPGADAAGRMTQVAQRLRTEQGLTGRPLATNRIHITLHHLGDHAGLPGDLIALANEAAAAVTFAPFDVVFDNVSSFKRPRNQPVVLRGGEGLAELIAFQQTLGATMKQAGLERWAESRYTPHATLLYDDRRIAEQTVETIGWRVHEFVLVHSLLGQTRHVPLARWSLSG